MAPKFISHVFRWLLRESSPARQTADGKAAPVSTEPHGAKPDVTPLPPREPPGAGSHEDSKVGEVQPKRRTRRSRKGRRRAA